MHSFIVSVTGFEAPSKELVSEASRFSLKVIRSCKEPFSSTITGSLAEFSKLIVKVYGKDTLPGTVKNFQAEALAGNQ